jgi:DNA-directed RNA polymerase subunit RPC12/RpoP
MKGHHTRRPGIRFGTCARCGDLFDLHKEPTDARGRYCSMTCLAAARRGHGAQIESALTMAPVEVALAPPPLATSDVH